MRKKIVAGNWKMNKNLQEGVELIESIGEGMKEINTKDAVEVILAPPFVHLSQASAILEGEQVALAAQNVHHEASGAYTGEVSAPMLSSVGVNYCLIGHSERRIYQKEGDEELKAKIAQCLAEQIKVIYCLGESLEDRESGREKEIVRQQLQIIKDLNEDQLKDVVIAYEPVWAIGTGKTASAEQAQEMHAFIRSEIAASFNEQSAEAIRILYGGSCKPNNAAELFSKVDVDGGLIGGAALEADSFLQIIKAAVR